MRAILTAVPGCGKTTIVKELQKKMDIDFVNYGDMMFKEAKKHGIKNRDQIRKKLSEGEQREIQFNVAKKIANMDSVLVDTHSTVRTGKGFFPGCPEKVIKTLKPDLFVIVEKSPGEIGKRRNKDPERDRDKESEKEIKKHQAMNRYYACVYSVLTGCPVSVIDLKYDEENKFDHARDAANRIAEMIS